MTRIAVITLLLLSVLSCKKTPTDSPVVPPEVEGVYVGWGRPGNFGTNVKLEFDSTATGWHGNIEFSGVTTTLNVTEVSADQDTVRFEYIRGSTYRYLGVVSNVAVTLYVLEPSGLPTFVLNKELNGYNLSGDWNGLMYSQYLQSTQHADMYMDQQGVLYDGDVQSSFGFYTLIGDILQGGYENAAFYFSGEAPFSGERYPFRFDGQYVNPDSIVGIWQVNIPGGGDSGTFAFGRDF